MDLLIFAHIDTLLPVRGASQHWTCPSRGSVHCKVLNIEKIQLTFRSFLTITLIEAVNLELYVKKCVARFTVQMPTHPYFNPALMPCLLAVKMGYSCWPYSWYQTSNWIYPILDVALLACANWIQSLDPNDTQGSMLPTAIHGIHPCHPLPCDLCPVYLFREGSFISQSFLMKLTFFFEILPRSSESLKFWNTRCDPLFAISIMLS